MNYDGPSGRAGEKLGLTVSLAPTANQKSSTLRAVWNVIDGDNKEQARGDGVLSADSSSTPVAFTPPTGGAYQLDVRLFDSENRLVERQREMIGIAAKTRAASRFLPKEVAPESGQPLMLGTMQVLFEAGQTHRLPQTELPSLIKWTEGAGLTPILVINWNELEPVEGCFAWHLLDRVLDMASKETGAFVGLRFAGDLLPQWLWFEELLSHNQQTINAEYHYSSPLGPRLRPALDRAWRAIAERYRDDPRVRGFFTAAGPSEGFLTDGSSVVSDYSPAGRETFRVWLKQQYGELAKINATWGERFTTWNDIQPPVPNYDLSWESSAAWWDWHRFKQSFTNERVDEMQKVLRASEPDRPITMYARQGFGATGELAPIFANNKFRYINGGGEGGLSYVQMSIMRNYNVPVTVEGHAVMPNLGSTNWVLLNSLLSGFGGNNVQMGAVWSKTSHKTPEYSAVQALQKRFAEAAPELSATRLETNWAGFYSNVHTMLRTRSFRNGGYPGVTDLNTVAQEGFHIPCAWVDDNTDAKILTRYPLLVDTGAQVLAPEGVKLLLDYARNGGTLVIGATTGRFTPGSAKPVDALLKQLGASEVTAQSTPPPANTDAAVPALSEYFNVKWNAAAKAKVVLADESGAPLLWQVDSGRGRVLVVAGTLDIKKSQSWLREIVLQFAGTPVVKIETTDNAVAGVLRRLQTGVRYVAMMLAPSKRALHDYNLTSAQIAAMGKADVTIRGPFKAGTQIENIADGTHITVMKDNEVTLSVQRGTLYCLKLPWRA